MPVIQSAISPASDAFRANAERMKALVADISAKAATVERGGSDEARVTLRAENSCRDSASPSSSIPARPSSRSASLRHGDCMTAISHPPASSPASAACQAAR